MAEPGDGEAGAGAPPPLVGLAAGGGSPPLGAPPELLPAEGGLGAPPALLALEEPAAGPPPPLQAPGGYTPHDTQHLQHIRTQMGELQRKMLELRGEEQRLAGQPRGSGAPPDLMGTRTPPSEGALRGGARGPGMPSMPGMPGMPGMGGWNFTGPNAGAPGFGGMGGPGPTGFGMPMGGELGGKPDSETMIKRMRSSMRFLDFIRDPSALVWVQKSIEDGAPEDVQVICKALLQEPPEVYTDPTSSSLIPALFTRLDDYQRVLLVEKLAQHMAVIAYNMHGTRVVQKTIEQIKPNAKEQIRRIIAGVRHQVPSLIKDLNGNHIVQEVLQSFSPEENQFVHDNVLGPRVVEFGTHRHGCCVLQRCIEYGSDEQKMRLVGDIITNGLCLVQDPFGNYLLQYILEMDVDFINVRVIRQFLGSIAALSVNKFASNVIEKCLKIAPDDVRQHIVDEICHRDKLPHLLQDQYANYVVQTALHTCNQQQFYQLQHAIRSLMHLIKNTPHGKRIETKLRTRTFDNSPTGGPAASPARPGGHKDSLGVTADGQWMRGGTGGQGNAGGKGGSGFRLNANARPFNSPPSSSRATPDKAHMVPSSETTSPTMRSLHPALVFGSLDD
eukprot:TRINITY_DN4727_c0_g1_i1.p1 TRINITY_DN4727_c0_g1~~TRINITY_DN4727_c0_g1_i1.p1  ORF type:complete len:629 (+),score=189.22 TRINITY_DN4727_c0_g1_i1:47-1888(+)